MRALPLMTGVTAVCLVVAISSGCGRSPRVSFYTLPVTAPEAATTTSAPFTVAVGPVTMPELVDRPQLVLRVEANRVDILETHRWAEPLRSGIPRLLAEDLARQLRPVRVSAYPQNSSGEADFRVLVDILRFESLPGEAVIVDALWSVRRSADVRKMGHSVKREPVTGKSYDALVAAHGRALAAVSADIAQAVREELVSSVDKSTDIQKK